MVKNSVVISRYWHEPRINVSIFHDPDAPKGGIRLEISLQDLIKAMAQEVRNPMGILTRAQLEAALTQASAASLEKIKEASTPAMTARK
jgi:hypothetical protein